MTLKATQKKDRHIAIAVRDGADLFVFLTIRRGPEGDVYVNNPRTDPNWKPHTSYHASGQHHHKSFGHKGALVRLRQKPDASFLGTENVVTQGIASDDPREINWPCEVKDYDDVVEIPVSELRPEEYRTALSVDITDTQGEPIVTVGARIIQQAIFKDTVPWIVVTLFETP
jgi:hypothetical protein